MKPDQRFTMQHEYCGYSEPRPVIRFCGEFVASHATYTEAVQHLAQLQDAAQWVAVQSHNNTVNLFAGDNGYRVAYGAHVTNHATYAEAAKEFDACVQHEMECNR